MKEDTYLNLSDEIETFLKKENIYFSHRFGEIKFIKNELEVTVKAYRNENLHFYIKDTELEHEAYDYFSKCWENPRELRKYYYNMKKVILIINKIEKMKKKYKNIYL